MIAKRNWLRKQILGQRLSMSPEEVVSLSGQVAAHLQDFSALQVAQGVMAFASIKNEVRLMPLLESLHRQGKTIYLPRVEGLEMQAAVFIPDGSMARGPFGIPEPKGPAMDPSSIDLVLVPGLVFDEKGYRLGYGKGYYDRFLPRLRPDALTLGVCYQFQVVEEVHPHRADIPVKGLVHEKGIQAVKIRKAKPGI